VTDRIVLACLLLLCTTGPVGPGPAYAAASEAAGISEVWALEEAYWRYLKAGDVENYVTLWHEDFIGWPCDQPHPLRKQSVGARVLWDLGGVAGLEIGGVPFFLHHPVRGSFDSPQDLGTTTVRVELFVDDPDAVLARALAAGASGSLADMRDYEMPWGIHRQGGFTDPFGHAWLVGDRSPLGRATGWDRQEQAIDDH